MLIKEAGFPELKLPGSEITRREGKVRERRKKGKKN